MLEALALWWEISLDPDSRVHDARFTHAVEQAITAGGEWTLREPERAEAWFYLGATYGARAQWRVLRRQRLSAAHDGKHIKATLERSLALDFDLHDADFGVDMYRYSRTSPRRPSGCPRCLFLLPGGDRQSGLLQMVEAREHGPVMRGEADYQLHLIYLWYENRTEDALALVHELQARYPHNPLFHHIEAEIHDAYLAQCGCQLRGVGTPPRAGRGPSRARARDRHGPRPDHMAYSSGSLAIAHAYSTC